MKTTIDLPDHLLEQVKVAAAQRSTTMKNLIIEGLESVLLQEAPGFGSLDALGRLRQGYHLGGRALTRDEAHAR